MFHALYATNVRHWWPWGFSNTLLTLSCADQGHCGGQDDDRQRPDHDEAKCPCVSVAKLNTQILSALGMAPSLAAPALTGSSHWSLSVSEVGPAPALLDSGWGRGGGLPWHYHWHCHHREFTIHSPLRKLFSFVSNNKPEARQRKIIGKYMMMMTRYCCTLFWPLEPQSNNREQGTPTLIQKHED